MKLLYRSRTLAAAALLAAVMGLAPAAQARTSVYLSIGVPGPYYAQPVLVQPAPVYVQPYPVLYVQPQPVYYVPAPVYLHGYGTYVRPHHRHGHRHHHHHRHHHRRH